MYIRLAVELTISEENCLPTEASSREAQLLSRVEIGRQTKNRSHGEILSGGNQHYCDSKRFLLSVPIPVEPVNATDSVLTKGRTSRLGTLCLQLDWMDEYKRDLDVPTTVIDKARSTQRWQESRMLVRAPTGSRYAVVHAQAAPENSGLMMVPLRRFLMIANRRFSLLRIQSRCLTDNRPRRRILEFLLQLGRPCNIDRR